MLKLRQYFCKHDYKQIAYHLSSAQNLWQCSKCKVFYIQHWGMGIGVAMKIPNLDGWVRLDKGKSQT